MIDTELKKLIREIAGLEVVVDLYARELEEKECDMYYYREIKYKISELKRLLGIEV